MYRTVDLILNCFLKLLIPGYYFEIDTVFWSCCIKEGDVQSSCWGMIKLNNDKGTRVGNCEASGLAAKNSFSWFLESISAVVLVIPDMWVAIICISNNAVKNHKQRRRYMANEPLAVPLLIAITKLWLSHSTSILFLAQLQPQTAELIMIGTNSFAMIPNHNH